MAARTQSDTKTGIDGVPGSEFEALQTILAAQGDSVSYEEAAAIGDELLGFFEAFGEDNEPNEDRHA